MTVRNMIQQLDEQSLHFFDRSFYSKVELGQSSDFIFDGYAKGKSTEEILELINGRINAPKVSFNQFKLAEKSIYNELLSWYELKAESRKDHLPSLVFYAVNQVNEDNDKFAARLENLFHELKENKIEHIACPLLKKLCELHKASPLEAVYQHLYNKYYAINANIDKVRMEFESLNNKLALSAKNGDTPEITKSMIQDFKRIRLLNDRLPNNVSAVYRDLSKLILIVACNQNQLLKDSALSLSGFISDCNHRIDALEFGVERFFLQNIFQQLFLLNKCNKHEESDLVKGFRSINEKQRNAYNFNFPTDIYRKIQRHIYHIDADSNCKLIQFYNWKDYGLNQLMPKAYNALSQNRDSCVTN